MCKKPILWILTLGLTLGLCACGASKEPSETPEPPGAAVSNDPNLGTYHCTSVKMDDMDIGPEGQWIQLKDQGKATILLMGEPDEGRWSLSGSAFTLTMSGEKVGTGTLENGVLTLDLMGTQCVFTKDGAEAPAEAPQAAPETLDETQEEEPDQPAAGYAYFSCYGELYRVTYPTDLFQPSGDGLTDLVGQDGTKGWVTRLDSKEIVDQWLIGLEAKSASQDVLSCENLTLTVAGYTAQAVVYEDAKGWHSAVVVNFGKDLGTKTYPMYAACLSFSGTSREAVWSDELQAMAASLELTP